MFTICGCFLFSGLSWIILPVGLVTNQSFAKGVIYFFSVLNALQGVFLFLHFFVTYQVLIGGSRTSFIPDICNIASDSSDEDENYQSKNK